MTLQTQQLADLLRVLLAILQQHAMLPNDRAKVQLFKDLNSFASRGVSEGRVMMRNHEWIPGGSEAFNLLRNDGVELTLDRITDLATVLVQMMVTVDRAKYDADLVDLMAKFLRSTRFQTNTLSGEALAALRRAILIPSELKELKDSLQKAFACSRCGRKMTGFRHLAVLSTAEDTGHEVHCVPCSAVSATSCATMACNEEILLTKEDQAVLQKLGAKKCEKHGGEHVERPPRQPRQGRDIFANVLGRQRAAAVPDPFPFDPEAV